MSYQTKQPQLSFIGCPACAPGLQCVACYLDAQALHQLEDARMTTLEGYEDYESATR